MAAQNLTARRCETAPAGEYADAQCPGLRLIVSSNGTRSWQYRYRAPGSKVLRRMHFAHFPTTTLADARIRWAELADLRRKGIDPLEHRAQQREQAIRETEARRHRRQRDTFTVRVLAERYLEAVSETHRSWRQIKWYLEERLLPELGHIPVMEVRRRDCMKLLDRVAKDSLVNRNRVKAWANAMWMWAIERDFPELEGLEYSPWASIKALPEQARTRILTEAELRALLKADTTIGQTTMDALLLDLYTGCRIGEIVKLHSDWVADDRESFTIPAEHSKNRRPHKVLLSDQARAILDRRPKRGYAFASQRRDHILYSTPAAELKRNPIPGTKHFTPHDLRRTMATWLGSQHPQCSREVIDRMLNHIDGSVTARHYNLASLDEPAALWWQAWADHLTSLSTSNVKSIGRARR